MKETAISLATRKRGVHRRVNGIELRVSSISRASFTSDYDASVVRYILDRLQPDSIVWNIGANVGVYALLLAKQVKGFGRVVAFEPNARAASVLRENARLNGLQDTIEVFETAVGDVVGETEFFVEGINPMSRAGTPNPLVWSPQPEIVRVATIDSLIERGLPRPNWLVMDIEGWEIAALRGGRRLICAGSDLVHIVVEMHPDAWGWSGESRTSLEVVLEELALEALALEGQSDPLAEHGSVVLLRRDASRRD